VINEREWLPADQTVASVYMGGAGTHAESNCDGCPGAWYRTVFALSFERYRRGPNGAVRTSDDRLIADAIQYYESEQNRYEAITQ